MNNIINIFFKISVTVLILYYIVIKFDINKALSLVTGWEIFKAILFVGIINSIQIILLSKRLRLSAQISGIYIKSKDSWVVCLLGGLFGNTPISAIGGNIVRVFQITKLNVSWAAATKVIILDCYLGFIGVILWVIISANSMLQVLSDPILIKGYWLLLVGGVMVIIFFLVLGFIPRATMSVIKNERIAEAISITRHIFNEPRKGFEVFLLVVIISLINIVSIQVISLVYQFNISSKIVFTAAPIVFLVSVLPVAVAGWGLREGAFVISLGVFGISPEVSVVVSITFGLAVLFSYLPAVLFIEKKNVRSSEFN